MTNLRNAPRVGGGSVGESEQVNKTLGESPPRILNLEEIGDLAELFAPGGIVSRLKRRLNRLKKKKCDVTPASGTIACIDDNDLVYLGVEFLREFRDQPDVLAGVMAHEWGHSCAEKPKREEVNQLNWNEIFDLRKAHETLADELSGRLLALMGFKPDGLIGLLKRGSETHNHKYHDTDLRAKIILNGYAEEIRKIDFARQLFPRDVYANDYHSKIVDDEI